MRPNVGLQMTKERVSLKVPRNSTNGIFFYIDVIPFVSQVEVTDEIVLGGWFQEHRIPATHFLFRIGHFWGIRVRAIESDFWAPPSQVDCARPFAWLTARFHSENVRRGADRTSKKASTAPSDQASPLNPPLAPSSSLADDATISNTTPNPNPLLQETEDTPSHFPHLPQNPSLPIISGVRKMQFNFLKNIYSTAFT